MNFESILFERLDGSTQKETLEAPAFFVDLNLDQIIDAITSGWQEYNLKPFFYTHLHDIETIQYRHAVMQDLGNSSLSERVRAFSKEMIIVRRYLGLVEKLEFKYHREGWFLEAARAYCDAVNGLTQDLSQADLSSSGLLALREYLKRYTGSDVFLKLVSDTEQLIASLSTVKYCVLLKNLTVRVRKYDEEPDYSVEVEETFEKFKQGAVKDYRSKLTETTGMNYVEAQILDCVAKLYPEIFAALDSFCDSYIQFLDQTIRKFDREVQFYIAYLEFTARLRKAGLNFCFPQVSSNDKEIYAYDGFDLALANKCIADNSPIVCNDLYLRGRERIFVVTGPNQGGKTTFARTFGQIHYLASLGCPVPGKNAQLFLYDRIFTHFEKEENIKNLRGKLQDDLVRISEILQHATPNSLIIMNEIFTSTTLQDAVFLSKAIVEKIIQLDLLCVCVTFLDELASISDKTVSVVSTVYPDNPAIRTYKIVRKPADGLSYAISIAEKHRLTHDHIQERIQA